MKLPRFRLRTMMIAIALLAPVMLAGTWYVAIGIALEEFYGKGGVLYLEAAISGASSEIRADLDRGLFREAEARSRRALEQVAAHRARAGRFADGWEAGLSLDLADALAGQGKFAEADPLYRKSLAFIEADRGPSNTARDAWLIRYARSLRKAGRVIEAKAVEARALAALGESAAHFRSERRDDVAEALEARAWAIRERNEP